MGGLWVGCSRGGFELVMQDQCRGLTLFGVALSLSCIPNFMRGNVLVKYFEVEDVQRTWQMRTFSALRLWGSRV